MNSKRRIEIVFSGTSLNLILDSKLCAEIVNSFHNYLTNQGPSIYFVEGRSIINFGAVLAVYSSTYEEPQYDKYLKTLSESIETLVKDDVPGDEWKNNY